VRAKQSPYCPSTDSHGTGMHDWCRLSR
jgi:hypothetical protein